jgi:hypothetical protein
MNYCNCTVNTNLDEVLKPEDRVRLRVVGLLSWLVRSSLVNFAEHKKRGKTEFREVSPNPESNGGPARAR